MQMRLADLVDINPPVRLRRGEQYPCVMMEDITPGRRYVSATSPRPFKGGAVFRDRDVLFARITPCLEHGKIAQYRARDGEAAFGSTEFFVFRGKEGVADQGFVYYLAMSASLRDPAVKSMYGASGRQRADLSVVKEIDVTCPPLPVQRKIASILSAYDDLIENNFRRIKILEAMAQSLYREWFIQFRFPGYEKALMLDSPLGRIPEGWEMTTLGQIATLIKRGISPKYDEASLSVVLNQRCIRDNHINLQAARHHSSRVPQEKLVRFGDILINSTGVGTLGRVAQVQVGLPNCTVDSHVTIVRPLGEVNLDFFGMQLIRAQDHFEREGRGATGQTELSGEAITRTQYLHAPSELQSAFGSLVSPVRRLASRLDAVNVALCRTRDLLLPKLISGELDVSALDIAVPKEPA